MTNFRIRRGNRRQTRDLPVHEHRKDTHSEDSFAEKKCSASIKGRFKLAILLFVSIIIYWNSFGYRGITMSLFYTSSEGTWEKIAAEKRAHNLAKIPIEWILPTSVIQGKRRVIAGKFFESLLDTETLSVTSLDSSELVQLTPNSSLTARQVCESFMQESCLCSPTSQ
jgi:hypothetical protein